MHSVLLQLPESNWIASNALAFAVRAPTPILSGHVLVAVRRAVPSYDATSPEERAALWALVEHVTHLLGSSTTGDRYEVSFTTGQLAGEAVPEAAVHVVPRPRASETTDSRGATPTVQSPSSASPRVRPLVTGGDHDPLVQHLSPLFAGATHIAIVAAFVTETGLALIHPLVFTALRAGAHVRVVTGDYLAFNQVDALRQLLGWSQLDVHADDPTPATPHGHLHVRVVETALPDGSERAFHPKSWLFESGSSGVAFVGSSNLSRSALETGIEWNLSG